MPEVKGRHELSQWQHAHLQQLRRIGLVLPVQHVQALLRGRVRLGEAGAEALQQPLLRLCMQDCFSTITPLHFMWDATCMPASV
jgi:hypothetical protein